MPLATEYNFQAEAKKSLSGAKVVYDQMGVSEHVRHVIVDSGHDYNKPMGKRCMGG